MLRRRYGELWLAAAQNGPQLDVQMQEASRQGRGGKRAIGNDPRDWDFNALFGIFLDHWESFFSKEFETVNPRTNLFAIKHLRN